MKILMVNSYNYLLGGIERVVFETTKMLESKGHEVIPFAMEDPRNQPSRYSSYFVKQRDISKVRFNVKGFITAFKMIYNREAKVKIGQLVRDVKPDVAHIHHMYGRLTPSILYELKKEKIPVVMTTHDYKLICPNYQLLCNGTVCEKCKGDKYYNAIVNRCVKQSIAASAVYAIETYVYKLTDTFNRCVDAFVAPSKFMHNKLIEFGCDGSKIYQIYNFLNIEDYTPNYQKEDYVLYYGRFSAQKGLSVLLDAMDLNRDKKLVMAGTGELEQDLKEMALSKGLNVHFCGFKSGDDLKDLVRKARVVVLPSICYENNPMVVLESFAMGTPVVGSDIGGIPELIQNGENGFLFGVGNSRELGEKIKRVFELDRRLFKDMGKRGRHFVEEHFCRETHYKLLSDLYTQVTS